MFLSWWKYFKQEVGTIRITIQAWRNKTRQDVTVIIQQHKNLTLYKQVKASNLRDGVNNNKQRPLETLAALNTLLGGIVFAWRETEQSHFTLQTWRRWLNSTAEPCWLLYGSNVRIPRGGLPAASGTTLRSTVASTQAAFTNTLDPARLAYQWKDTQQTNAAITWSHGGRSDVDAFQKAGQRVHPPDRLETNTCCIDHHRV